MKKDMYLVNIYLKIHHKQTLTMDDLRYLAEYAPECFEKTCKNVVYNIPETKPIMTPPPETAQKSCEVDRLQEIPEEQNIEKVLDNLKRLESNEFPLADVDAEQVKSLLGNLYMEMLFPHNDRDTFFDTSTKEKEPSFDWKV